MLDTIRRSFEPAYFFVGYLFRTSSLLIFSMCLFFAHLHEFLEGLPAYFPNNSTFEMLIKIALFLVAVSRSLFFLILIPGRFHDYRAGAPPRPFLFLLKKYSGQLVLEGLRVTVKTLLWSLLLVLPGVFQMWRLYLVPLIVVLNTEYDEGRLDALTHSHNLIRGHDFIWVIFLICIGFLDLSSEFFIGFASGLSTGLLTTIFTQNIGIASLFSATAFSLLSLIGLPFALYSYSLLVHVYEGLEQKFSAKATGGENGTHV